MPGWTEVTTTSITAVSVAILRDHADLSAPESIQRSSSMRSSWPFSATW
jgi:hypothetical protein